MLKALLFKESTSEIIVSPEMCFSYDTLQYPYNILYKGKYKFTKHYYPDVGDLKEKGEEYNCAQYLEELPEIKFWVRNLERRQNNSFWLQTSSDKFYPDFVCLLNDGRYLVVEYKGEDRWSNDDSIEKREIGNLWETRSNGKCLFVMPKGMDLNSIKVKILQK